MPARPPLQHQGPLAPATGRRDQGPPHGTVPRGWAASRRLDLLSGVLDAVVESAVASFALWTLLYHLALVAGLPARATFAGWVAVSVAVVVLRARYRWRLVPAGPHTGAAVVLGLVVATLSAVVVRPDLDDASYTVRGTWVAARGAFGTRDVIFSDGRWPALAEQTPYLPAVETLAGLLARATGMHAADLLYGVYVPVASFAAVWALWMLLRSWGARRPAAALLLALLFLLWGGATHGSWGNLHLLRIWQGKVTFLSVVVPLVYCWAARYWAAPTVRGRRTALALVGLAGVAGVGLTPAAIFVLPCVVLVAAVVGLVTHRVPAALRLVLVGAAYPLGAGAVVLLIGSTRDVVPGVDVNPWVKTLGTGLPLAVAVLAAVVAVGGLVLPRLLRTSRDEGRLTAGASVLAGALIAVPALYSAAVDVMGTNAIAWRLVWLVPLPALVGLLACLPRGRVPVPAGAVPVAVAAALVLGGTPLWSPSNGAVLARPGDWKMYPEALATARWVVGSAPTGPYLAREEVVAAVGTITAELRPVGSRPGYLAEYEDQPGAAGPDRLVLQRWANSAAGPADLERVPEALAALEVRTVCLPPEAVPPPGAGWTEAFRGARDVCWRR